MTAITKNNTPIDGEIANNKPSSSSLQINPAVILLAIVFLAVLLTYIVDSGEYKRKGELVLPGTFQQLEKKSSPVHLFSVDRRKEADVKPVSIIEGLMAIPKGLVKQSGLIFMVVLIGGMFGVLNSSGTIDSGLTRMLALARGNIYILVPSIMLILSLGSSCLGMAKEYVMVVPLMVAMAHRMGLPTIIGLAIVVISVKIGFLSSISNPVALGIAQPIVGLPVFSGMDMRAATFVVFMLVGTAFVLMCIRRTGVDVRAHVINDDKRLSVRHVVTLVTLLAGVSFLVYASNTWKWKFTELSAYYIGMSIVFAAISGIGATAAADAFLNGMKKVMMAGLLIGLATAVEDVLSTGKILDSIVNWLAGMIGGHSPTVSAFGMFFSQLFLDVLIPSTSGGAAVTMPIFGPLGQLTGVTAQTSVYAFLLGHGLTNMITPTSSGLLVLLATAQVGWGQWARFILPLFFTFFCIALVMLAIAVSIGY